MEQSIALLRGECQPLLAHTLKGDIVKAVLEAVLKVVTNTREEQAHITQEGIQHTLKANVPAGNGALECLKELSTELAQLSTLQCSALIQDSIGLELMTRGDPASAAFCFHNAVSAAQFDPESDRIALYFHLCEAYFSLGKVKTAVRFGSQAALYARNSASSTKLLISLYSLLARCEEKLKRFDRAKVWLKRSLFVLKGGSLTPVSPEQPVTWGRLHPRSGPGSPVPTVRANKNEEKPEEKRVAFPRSGSVGDLDRKRLIVTKADAKMDVLRVSSRETSASSRRQGPRINFEFVETQHSDIPPLYQCWKTLANGRLALIQVSENSSQDWLITVKTPESGGSVVHETVPLGHEWRAMRVETLARRVEVARSGRLMLGEADEKKQVKLRRELREFGGERFKVTYWTDEKLSQIEVKAQSQSACLSRVILNDIHLPTLPSLIAYTSQVLSPNLRIARNRIHITPNKDHFRVVTQQCAEVSPGKVFQRVLFTGNVVIFPNIPASVTITKSDIAWTIHADFPESEKLSVLDTDIKDICGSGAVSETEIAKRLAGRLIFEEGVLRVRTLRENVGVVIRIAKPESGTQVYIRNYQILKENYTEARTKAAIRIQSFVRGTAARRTARLLRRKATRVSSAALIQRFGVATDSGYCLVNILKSRALMVEVATYNVVSKETVTVHVPTLIRRTFTKRDCLTLYHQFESRPSSQTGPQSGSQRRSLVSNL